KINGNRTLLDAGDSVTGLNPFGTRVTKIDVYGRSGDDRIAINTNLTARAVIYGGTGNDTVFGGSGNDPAFGGDGNDWLYGHGGDDQLFGNGGYDVIEGGPGNDWIDGGRDGIADLMTGNSGYDTFVIHRMWRYAFDPSTSSWTHTWVEEHEAI